MSGPFCEQCGVLNDLPDSLNYFSLLGVDKRLDLDETILHAKHIALCRTLHPDRFINASPLERSYALRWTTAVNNAYRLLRDPVTRTSYLLDKLGYTNSTSSIPLELAEEYFELQELLEESESAEKLANFKGRLEGLDKMLELKWQALAHENQQDERWAKGLQENLCHRKYLSSMLSDIERTLCQS